MDGHRLQAMDTDLTNQEMEMQAYWIKFENGTRGCVEAESQADAERIAAELEGDKVASSKVLPYPASPRLNEVEHVTSSGQKYITPSFCFKPDQCCGFTACPQNYSCTE